MHSGLHRFSGVWNRWKHLDALRGSGVFGGVNSLEAPTGTEGSTEFSGV